MKTKNKEILSVILRIAVALTIFVAVIVNYDRLVNLDLRVLVGSISVIWYAYLAVIGVYALKSVVFVVPAMMIYVSVGISFDTPIALILNFIGLAVEVTITFFLGKFLGGEYVTKLLEKNKGGKKLLNIKTKTKNSFLFVARVVPAFPIDFTSLFLGSSNFKFIPYFLISMLGIYPRVLLFTIIGDSIYKYIPKELIIKLIIIAIPAAIIGFVIYRLIKKRKK
ncbi:MAG: VTT domain-containing protein [Clostridia bacterium]|nr:VTT domain-containing protein [Clostridia bacterium]